MAWMPCFTVFGTIAGILDLIYELDKDK